MRRILLIIFILSVIEGILSYGEGVTIKVNTLNEKDIIDWTARLEENEVFYRNLNGFELSEEGGKYYLYYLEGDYAVIYKVDLESGRLIKTISSPGQGPGELIKPMAMAVKYGKILIYDPGFGGIKIFDTDGKILKEFRIESIPFYSLGMHQKDIIDLSSGNEIFIRNVDEKSNTCIIVYDLNGTQLRRIIPLDAEKEKDTRVWVLNTYFNFEVDKNGDIVILYVKKGLLRKYDIKGKLKLERNLYDDLAVKDRNEEQLEIKSTSRSFQVTYRLDFYGFCLTESGDVFVSTHGGGIYYTNGGFNPLYILKQSSGEGFGTQLEWYNQSVITPNKMYKVNHYK